MQELSVIAPSLLAKLCIALDGRDYDALAACFAPAGTWTRQGKTLRGREEIRKTLADTRPATLSTIHIVTNTSIDAQSERAATGRFYLTVYRHDGSSEPPYPVPAPSVVGLCKVEFVYMGDEWLLQHLQTGPYVFSN